MRLRDPRLWLGGASMALVAGLFALDFERTSPGPLSASHAGLERLQGKRGCAACHGGWLTSLAGACLDCHEEIEDQLETESGLHGAAIAADVGAEGVRACAMCHVEHHGDQLPLAGEAAFALAGFASIEDFDHGHVDFALVGVHAELTCARCHEAADAEVLAEGQPRFLGLDQTCTGCHEDPHEGRFARGCESCHGQEKPFGELASFTHGEAFPLVGAHARPACLDCHEEGGGHEVTDLAGHAPPPPGRTCLDCHASPHRSAFTAAAGALLELAPGETCSACHDAERGPFEGEAARMPAELHAASGFALDAPHAAAACEDCHAAGDSRATARPARLASAPLPPEAPPAFALRYPGRPADDCAACHPDPHGGQFDVEPYARQGCLACHERTAFDPPAFGLEEHARCAFPLDRSHVAVACSTCHLEPAPPDEGPRLFRGTPGACADCHEDSHTTTRAGVFAAAPQVRASEGGCSACHETGRFADVDREAFDHRSWTAFALDGAHARADCETCHPPQARPEPDGRTFGRAAERFPGPADRCESCHADPHRGAFEAASDAGGCERCHVTDDFRAGPVLAAFDHGAWTGFGLAGAHARAECASCHGEAPAATGGPLSSPRSLGFVSDRVGAADTCGGCHEDPHRGRFDEPDAPAASCERCHGEDSFAEVDTAAFDHSRWTGFELAGEHARIGCEDCHAPSEAPAGGMVRLGAARGSACSACHVDPHVGQFAREGRTDCAACHLAERGFRELDFDHQRDARFALDARHADLACSACHVLWPLRSGEKVVRYKPLGTECIDCHDHGGRQGGGRSGVTTGGTAGGSR